MIKIKPEIPKQKTESKSDFLKTLCAAILCAAIVRSFFFEPFHIPSSSMKPNLLIGDYIFVSKFSYGYSRYSFPFGLNLFEGRIFKTEPKRGDIVVFRLPSEPSINYVKRLIGLPGDKIQVKNGVVYINEQEIKKTADGFFVEDEVQIAKFLETLSDQKTISTLDQVSDAPQDNTNIYEVPQGSYFMMGDNRDNSQDSRFLTQVGYIPEANLVGRAKIIFFSTKDDFWKFWLWNKSIRFDRILKKIN